MMPTALLVSLERLTYTPWFAPPGRGGAYRYTRRRWRLLFAIVDTLGWLMCRVARSVAAFARTRKSARTPAATPASILLIQLDHLGDALLSTGLLRGLRDRFPQARIDVLAAPWNQEVFSACPEVTRVHVCRRNRFDRSGRAGGLLSVLWWGWRLRGRYDLAIDVRGEAPLALAAWLTRAARRIGWDAGGCGFLLTDSPAWLPGRHEVLSRQAILEICHDRPAAPQTVWSPAFDCGDEARRTIERGVRRLAMAARPLVLLHVGGGMPAKRWPAQHWRELAQKLVAAHAARVVLVGTDQDRATAEAIVGPHGTVGIEDWTGLFDVLRLAALFERADLFVGGDSGPAHLAAAVGTPVVALFSGTNDAEQWRPWGDDVTVLRHSVVCSPCHRTTCPLLSHPCLTQLRPETVLHAAGEMLGRRPHVLRHDPPHPIEPIRTRHLQSFCP